MWEIWTCLEPYEGAFKTFPQLIDGVGIEKMRPRIPPETPRQLKVSLLLSLSLFFSTVLLTALQELMIECWDHDPTKRPSFATILKVPSLFLYLSIRVRVRVSVRCCLPAHLACRTTRSTSRSSTTSWRASRAATSGGRTSSNWTPCRGTSSCQPSAASSRYRALRIAVCMFCGRVAVAVVDLSLASTGPLPSP